MGKITPRFFFIALISGWFLLSGNTLLANITYGPEKPGLKEKQQKNLFFVGFLLELAPSITLSENTPANCSDAQDGALNIDVSGGVSPYSYSWSGPNNFSSTNQRISGLAPGNYTVTVTDSNEDTANASFTVEFEDLEAPTVNLRNIEVELDSNGSVSIQASDIDNGSSDNCGIDQIAISKTNFSCTDVGDNTVSLSVTDINGNTATKDAIVTVKDNIAPNVISQNITVQLDENGTAIITADQIDNGSTDACGIQSTSLDISTFDCTDIGANTVTLSVTDNNNNTATKNATVTVEDKITPQVITQNITVQLDENGAASITADQIDNGSTDACGIESTSLDISTFDCTDIGANLVTLSVTDNNNNTATKNATITIEDNITPQVITQNITVQLDENGTASITADQIDNGSTDACGIESSVVDISTFDCIDIGENTVTLSVTDIHNNTASNTAIVTVEDKIKPVLPTLYDITWGCEYIVETPVAIDNCGGDITAEANRSTTFTETGSIIWTFTDASGNSASIEQNITINQIEVNVQVDDILCNGFASGEAQAIVTGGVGEITYDWGELGNGAVKDGLSPGTYSVTATDVNGCSATKDFTITEPDSFIEITSISINKGCFEENNASITVEAHGGTGQLTYNWSNGQTGATISNVNNTASSNNLSLTITDENGCSIEETITVYPPEELVITNIVDTETNTFGSATGTATAIIEGGTANFEFLWSDGQTGQTASNLAAGTYSVVVTDANGCTDEETITIIDPLEASMIPTSKCLSDEGGLRTSTFQLDSVQGGIAPYTYKWDFGGETAEFSDTNNQTEGPGVHVVNYLESAVYPVSLTVTDSVGNEYTEVFNHYVGECFEPCGQTENLDFELDTFYIGKEDGSPLTGAECASYSGKRYIYLRIEKNANAYNPSIEFIYSISQGGEFISEERITGCIDIGNDKIPSLFRIGEIENWSCGNAITLESFYMDWTNNANKKCGDVRQRMCVSTNENDEIHFPLSARIEKIKNFCYGDEKGSIEIIPTGGVGTYHYELQNTLTGEIYGPKDTRIFQNLPAGTYKAMVHDDNETYTVNNIIITQPENALLLEEIDQTPLVCFGGSNATATVKASGGTAPYTIVWDHISQTSTETTGTANNLSAGTYAVNVVDANGCEFSTEVTIAQPEELIANAGEDKTLECGVNQVKLGAVFEGYTNPRTQEEEFGTWRIINGPTGAVISDPNNPESLLTITTTGTYTLEWTIPCGSKDRVKIIFSNCSTIDFDGVDDYIDFGNNLNLTSGFTLEAWVKQDQNATTSIKTILSKRDNANLSTGGYDLIIENNTPKFRWNNEVISSTHQIDSDRWYHIAVIQGGNDAGIYIDGIKTGESAPGIPSSIDNRFLIGAMNDNTLKPLPSHFFHGWIEEVRIWNTSLNLEQLKFMMNQRIKNNTNVRGEIIPLDVPNNLKWETLKGYYRLITSEATNGITKNKIPNGIDGRLKNIQSTQQNTAPLPYIATGGDWWNINSWKQPQVWDTPNSAGVNGERINWNIARLDGKTLTNAPTTDNSNSITLLGLLDDGGSLIMNGTNHTSGNELYISRYLELNGHIDLNGESQLVQPENSQISGSGNLERDQQGTASSFNYNYWSSPVISDPTNTTYKVNQVMKDGSNLGTNKFQNINFKWPHTHADGPKANPIKISDYWINAFRARAANEYSQWEQIGSYTALKPGEGYTMKGTENIDITEGKLQNYTFNGFPNNGIIEVSEIRSGQNYLLGNPYPSAISVEEFILDNIRDGEGRNDKNLLNGAVYFWDHFAGKTHYLAQYVGGYAVRNLIDGVPAVSTDSRINASGDESNKRPGAYIPVAQGFFVNTTQDPQAGGFGSFDTGNIIFKNSQRYYETEQSQEISFFLQARDNSKSKQETEGKSEDGRYKIRLLFRSPTGYHRELLVGADARTSQGFDLGFDAPLIDRGPEDMYWVVGEGKYVIQGVPHFNLDQVLPLGFKIAEEKEFIIEIGELENLPEITEIYLRDNSDSTYHDLRKEAYKATLPAGEYQDLYEIVFQDVTSTREDKEPGEGPIDYFYSMDEREFVISNPELHEIEHINIYNITGQLVDQHFGIPDIKEIHIPQKKSLSSGVYIVKIYTSAGDYAKKIIIRKD
ncbi:LamG-like jellyroll fold domain-containing protein [Salegentibacter sp. UBA1130]|uniref:LamG-like jellyroll fold domain-containing protein n=1 Tax=Salegentibacter sp. UBA1130 TaxID=1947451 RepID=UPI00257B0A05|nr:LamG-like jellyroll fold domain-containing protein [Salegentibacter sp. UBA1130]